MSSELNSPELSELAATFLRGTARAALPTPGPGPLGAALQAVQRSTPEETLLARAALSGLYAQAGRVPATVETPAPVFVATSADERPKVPEALLALLPALSERPEVLHQTLGLMAAAGLKLTAPPALPLLALTDGGNDRLSGPLWTLLDEHARWLARLNPAWKRHDLATPPDSLRLTRLRRELVETHALQPEAAAAEMLERWPRFRADERRAALGAAAGSLHRADLPLLLLAMTDKLPDVRRQARLLQGHLPGEVQEQARAALKAALSLDRKGKLKLTDAAVTLPPALNDADLAKDKTDSDLRRVLGALPLGITLELVSELDRSFEELTGALREWCGSSSVQFETVLDDLRYAAYGAADLNVWTLAQLGSYRTPLEFWPQERIRQRLWQALEVQLRQQGLDSTLLLAVHALLAALTDPLPLTPASHDPASQPPPKKGLLARLASAFEKRPEALPPSWSLRLEQLAERVLQGLSLDPQGAYQAQGPLLQLLALHLDPLRAAPALPLFPPPPRPEQKPTQETLGRADRQEYDREQVRQRYAGVLEVLALRRRVQELLSEPA